MSGFAAGARWLAAIACWATAAAWAQGDGKPAVSVRIAPATAVEPGTTVTIEGLAPLDGKGLVAIRITRPDRSETALEVKPAADGDYSARYAATEAVGSYRVEVRSPGGQMRGEATFEVALQEPLDDIEAAEQEAQAVATLLDSTLAELDQQIVKLPDSPARDELKQRLDAARPKFQSAAKELRDFKGLVMTPLVDPVKGDPALKPALKPIGRALRDWQTRSEPERRRIVAELARSRQGSVTCESIERIVEGFKLFSALLNLAGGPVSAVKSVIFDYVASAGSALAAKLSEKFAFPVNVGAKIALAVGEAQARGAWKLKRVAPILEAKQALITSLPSIASDLAAYVAERAFARYCERLAGPFKGGMVAEFKSGEGKPWWRYTIEVEGRLDLRYAKGATGEAVAVKGDFLGQATRFTLWEDALKIGWPSLTAGAVMFKRAVLPRPDLINLLTGQRLNPDASLKEEKPIEVEGKAAAVFVKPYSFFVPVEGEIVDGVLSLRRKPATIDYEAAARVVYVVVSPLSAMLGPQFTTFELPYKSGGFIIERAFGDGIRVAVKKTAKGFVVDETLKVDKGDGRANGQYRIKLKLCNPEGSC
ncbi:MAG: hypothetical protein NTW01_15520 [Gammaproteobacteria bacterium]|uniref:hypothetical protein n=1 Tax=Nevskia sp. TaxID=1929292 RepID=UPI0040362CFB|nr:hypothetical protein [Gammaproteobacteria bacterium]